MILIVISCSLHGERFYKFIIVYPNKIADNIFLKIECKIKSIFKNDFYTRKRQLCMVENLKSYTLRKYEHNVN